MIETNVVRLEKLDSKQRPAFDRLVKESEKNEFFFGNEATHIPKLRECRVITLANTGVPIGYYVPTKTSWKSVRYWRSGTVYLTRAYRQQGIMGAILTEFFATHKPALAWIEDTNVASIALYKKLGFVQSKPLTYFNKSGHWYILGGSGLAIEQLIDKPVYINW